MCFFLKTKTKLLINMYSVQNGRGQRVMSKNIILEPSKFSTLFSFKLDGVGPVYTRPSTNKLH